MLYETMTRKLSEQLKKTQQELKKVVAKNREKQREIEGLKKLINFLKQAAKI